VAECGLQSLYPLSITAKVFNRQASDALFRYAGDFGVFGAFKEHKAYTFRAGWSGLHRVEVGRFFSWDEWSQWQAWSKYWPTFGLLTEFRVERFEGIFLDDVFAVLASSTPLLKRLCLVDGTCAPDSDSQTESLSTCNNGCQLKHLRTLRLVNLRIGTDAIFALVASRVPNVQSILIFGDSTTPFTRQNLGCSEPLPHLRQLWLSGFMEHSPNFANFSSLEKLEVSFIARNERDGPVAPNLFDYPYPRLKELVYEFTDRPEYIQTFTAALSQGRFPKLEKFKVKGECWNRDRIAVVEAAGFLAVEEECERYLHNEGPHVFSASRHGLNVRLADFTST